MKLAMNWNIIFKKKNKKTLNQQADTKHLKVKYGFAEKVIDSLFNVLSCFQASCSCDRFAWFALE